MSLRLKTVLGVAFIEACLLIILLSYVLGYMRESNEDNLTHYANTTSNLFATITKDAVISYDLASAESYVSEILKNQGVYYARIFDANDVILASGKNTLYTETPFKQDLQLSTVEDGIFDIQKEIVEGNTLYGYVQLGISTVHIKTRTEHVQKFAITIAIFEMILVALFSFVLGIYLTKQLRYLQKAAKKVAEGDFNHQLKVNGKDEVADVTNSFNRMILSLRESDQSRRLYRKKLEELNRDLEKRVEKRTQQLSQKNEQLESAYSELKNTQLALVQSEKMASLGQMAAGVAHEINNPMAFVKSNLNTLDNYLNTYDNIIRDYTDHITDKNILIELNKQYDFEFIQEDIRDVIKDSQTGALRIADIVKGLKSFSRVDEVERQEIHIDDCIHESVKIASLDLKEDCTIKLELNKTPPIQCNPGKINQILLNLLVNAKQAITGDGEIKVSSCSENTMVLVKVRDNGKGIPKENMEKLFDPFFTTKPVGEGTGLGLSIAHSIAQEHGGSLTATSTVGAGSEFILALPIHNNNANQLSEHK